MYNKGYSFKRIIGILALRLVGSTFPMSNKFRLNLVKFAGVNVKSKNIHIGEGVILDSLYPEEIELEDNVQITMRCIILTHYLSTKKGGRFYKGKVKICKGAFIGANTIICSPVRIGEKSIVAAGSIVTKDIPDGERWGGNPAKFIKKREM